MRKKQGKIVPAFASEAQEADWWFRNRRNLDADFQKAAKSGELKRIDRKTLLSRISASTRVVSIRLPEADLALAREQSARMGLPYQTYIKSLLHRALTQAK
jgi:predicted DNA binding CopG/RHH family protein